MEDNPIVSIVTPSYNQAQFLEATILSVLSQDYPHIEYIIIDGKSDDNTLKITQKYHSQIDQIISAPDQGVYDAMNKGFKLAKGKYVLYINAGDGLCDLSILEKINDLFKDSADVVYGETNILNEAREMIGTRSQLTSRKLPDQL